MLPRPDRCPYCSHNLAEKHSAQAAEERVRNENYALREKIKELERNTYVPLPSNFRMENDD